MLKSASPPPTPRVYMLKKCVALPLVIKRPVLQSAGTHRVVIKRPVLQSAGTHRVVIRRPVLQSAGTHV